MDIYPLPGARLRRVPNQPKTPARSLRVPDELWEDSRLIAEAEGFEGGVSGMVRDCLEKRRAAYIEEHGGLPPRVGD